MQGHVFSHENLPARDAENSPAIPVTSRDSFSSTDVKVNHIAWSTGLCVEWVSMPSNCIIVGQVDNIAGILMLRKKGLGQEEQMTVAA